MGNTAAECPPCSSSEYSYPPSEAPAERTDFAFVACVDEVQAGTAQLCDRDLIGNEVTAHSSVLRLLYICIFVEIAGEHYRKFPTGLQLFVIDVRICCYFIFNYIHVYPPGLNEKKNRAERLIIRIQIHLTTSMSKKETLTLRIASPVLSAKPVSSPNW